MSKTGQKCLRDSWIGIQMGCRIKKKKQKPLLNRFMNRLIFPNVQN